MLPRFPPQSHPKAAASCAHSKRFASSATPVSPSRHEPPKRGPPQRHEERRAECFLCATKRYRSQRELPSAFLRASAVALRFRTLARGTTPNGDQSPAESGENSPHSKCFATCEEFRLSQRKQSRMECAGRAQRRRRFGSRRSRLPMGAPSAPWAAKAGSRFACPRTPKAARRYWRPEAKPFTGLPRPTHADAAIDAEEESADREAWDAEQRAKASLELQQRRDAEEGVCDCCGQRFVERTRVRQAGHKPWTGVLARHPAAGVCPACANRYGAF